MVAGCLLRFLLSGFPGRVFGAMGFKLKSLEQTLIIIHSVALNL